MTWSQSLGLDKDPTAPQKQLREVKISAETLAGWPAKLQKITTRISDYLLMVAHEDDEFQCMTFHPLSCGFLS